MAREYLSNNARDLIERYLRIKVGKFEIPCPYFMNERALRNLPIAYSGKGLPEEIEAEIEKIIRVNKKRATDPLNTKNLMILCSLGVDCSGFVANVLNEHLKEKIGKSIFEVIKYPNLIWSLRAKLRPRTNISASLLTGNLNSVPVQLGEVRPGDMVQRGGHHVMLVEWVDIGKSLGYVESDTDKKWEVSRGEIKFKDVKKPLEMQDWLKEEDLELYKRTGGEKGLRRLRSLV